VTGTIAVYFLLAGLSGPGHLSEKILCERFKSYGKGTGEITLLDCVMKRGSMDSHPDFPGQGLPAGKLVRESVTAYLPGRSRTTLNSLPEAEVSGTDGN